MPVQPIGWRWFAWDPIAPRHYDWYVENLIAYEEAMVLGRFAATVTDTGIVLTGRVRRGRDNDFRIVVCPLLRQLAEDAPDDEVSGFVVDVFDRALVPGPLGEAGHVRFYPAHEGDPSLQAHSLLATVATRIARNWPIQIDQWTP
jgi:hypothetical protein